MDNDLFEQMIEAIQRNSRIFDGIRCDLRGRGDPLSAVEIRKDIASLERQINDWQVLGRLDHETDQYLKGRLLDLKDDLIEAEKSEAIDFRNGQRFTAIIKAIDAYVAKDGNVLDLGKAKGWHRFNLAADIVNALEEIE